MDVNGARWNAEHSRQQFLITVRHFGGAVHFENAARRIVTANGAARLQRYTGMPADRDFDFDHMRGRAKYHIDVAIALADDRRLARMAGRILDGRRLRVEQRRQFLDLDCNQIGGILGGVGVLGEDGRNGVADITHDPLG